MIEVQWRKVALCFNVTTLGPVDCGNLYGGYRGSCPKFSTVTFPYPLPKTSNVSKDSVILNVIYNNHFQQRESMIVIMLLVLIICFIAYLNIK